MTPTDGNALRIAAATPESRPSHGRTHPKPSPEERVLADAHLDRFSALTKYRHGARNPYLRWLNSVKTFTVEQVLAFLSFWYPVSRGQPQLLYLFMSAFPEHADRRRLEPNVREEDGMVKQGDNPHYDLLQRLIEKLGGRLDPDPRAVALVHEFDKALQRPTAAEAAGLIAGVEHPGLDISAFLRRMIEVAGFEGLLATDPYLYIHVDVEPLHIIWAHGHAEQFMARGSKEKNEVITGFTKVMKFWERFWPVAFTTLGAPPDLQSESATDDADLPGEDEEGTPKRRPHVNALVGVSNS